MTPRVSDLIEIINSISPFCYAENWDNVGLQVGDPSAPASKIMVSLDACDDAVDAAIAGGCRLLVTHHPLIFRPVKSIDLRDPIGSIIGKILRHSLSVVSLHTNLDISDGGVNDFLSEKIGLAATAPLSITRREELIKLAVFVPRGYEEQLMDALFRFGGFLGNYCDCSFQSGGMGTYRPLPGAEPFLGTVGKREYAEETRLEVLLRKADLEPALAALRVSHPYEEPAYDLYPVLNTGKQEGLGRIGVLDQPISLEKFALRLRDEFSLDSVRFVGEKDRMLQRVAICGGSGASLLRESHRKGADVLVTGDVKYHDACEARSLALSLVDIGHFASEILMVDGLAARLETAVRERGLEVEILRCKEERDPFQYR